MPRTLLDRPITDQELAEVGRHLEWKIAGAVSRKRVCAEVHERIEELKEDRLDALDERADGRARGRVSRGEKRAAKGVEASATQDHITAKQCEMTAETQIMDLRSILANPARLRAEVPALRAEMFQREQSAARQTEAALASSRASQDRQRAAAGAADERRSEEARQQHEVLQRELLGLLGDAQGASEILVAGSYDAFALRLRAIDLRIRSLRGSKYAAGLQNSEYKALGQVVSETVSGLYAAGAEWKVERQAAGELANAEEAVKTMKSLGGATAASLEGLKAAQHRHEQAHLRLTAQRETVPASIAKAVAAAR